MRAIIYVRTSKEDQSEYSIDRQIQQCQDYCIAHNWPVVGVYSEEHSARKGVRPVFQSLFKEHWAQWDVLIVMRLDRAWRQVYQALGHLTQMSSGGKSFVSLREQLDTTSPWGKFVLTVLIALAELEADIISERSRAGWASRRKKAETAAPGQPRPPPMRRCPRWFADIEKDGGRFREPTDEAMKILERVATESISQVARSLHLPSTEPLYRLRRYVDEWKATGPWILPTKRLSSAGAS